MKLPKNTEVFFMSADEFENAPCYSWMAERLAEKVDAIFCPGPDLDEIAQVTKDEAQLLQGWYWWTCCPGCMPDSDAFGPFACAEDAIEDAIEDRTT